MSLNQRITDDLKISMKQGDRFKTETIRMIRSSLKNAEIDKGKELADEDVVSVLSSEAKKRKESASEYRQAGRMDLVENEEKELEIIQSYLPQQLPEYEVRIRVNQTFDQVKPASSKDMGKVMGVLMKELKGIADGKLVQELVKKKFESIE